MEISNKKFVSAAAAFLLLPAGMAMAGDIHGKVTATGIKSPENVVVYVDVISGKSFPAPTQHTVVDQKNLKFVPHVVAVVKGTTVDFLNSDNVGHNVFWPSIGGNKKLYRNLGTWPKGETKSYTFNDLGAAPLLCNVHPEMSGYIVVVPTPYFAVTDKEGQYEIKGVPPGKYSLKTWSEEGKPASQDVEVTAGAATANISIHR